MSWATSPSSGRAKPAGVLLVPQGSEREFLLPLPVRKFPGIGPRSEERMLADDIVTLGDLASLPTGPRRAKYARAVAAVERELRGEGTRAPLGRERPAFREHDPVGLRVGSISNERTFFEALGDDRAALDQLLRLTERVCFRARKRGMLARTITLKLRYVDFHTLSRSRSIEPTNEEAVVLGVLTELYGGARTRRLAIRLLGVGLSHLVGAEDPRQLLLPFERKRPVGTALDRVRGKFGYDAVHLGGSTRRTER